MAAMTRPEADALVTAYDDAQRAYRFAVRIGMESKIIEAEFAKWNGLRERLIGLLAGEGESARVVKLEAVR